MPETVKLGDKYWMVQRLSELDPDETATVATAIEEIDRAHNRDDTETIYSTAVTLLDVCVVDEVNPDSIHALSVEEIGSLISAIDEHPDTGFW